MELYKAKVSDKKIFNTKFCLLKLELMQPHRIEFRAGQYILLSVPGIDQKKHYSITSSPSMDHAVELLVDITPGGTGSGYLNQLNPGDDVEFRAPVGEFVLAEDNGEESLVFVASGSGISPIRSMILDLLENREDTRPMKLHWGLRYVEDMFWENDFREMAVEFDNFDIDITLSRPPLPEWKLCDGRVSDCLRNHPRDFSKTGFYICGNREMIEEVREILKEKGVEDGKVHFEKFY